MTPQVRTGYGMAAGWMLYRFMSFALGYSVVLALGLVLVHQAGVAIGLVISLWLLQKGLGRMLQRWRF